ncbi:MAG: hypothetical protein RMJ51_06595 [Candidatus Calescibacterium sp.]|nr:hypothetical protein [Candidatus Calescibacterium sp.]MCX7758391.1 hypothetical protein [bacterium]MDW8195886.1 hypothetical protein [Candidatus Calescibacterium sp.]
MPKNKRYLLLIFIAFISTLFSFHVTSIEKFIYDNLKLAKTEYKFIDAKINNMGELIYTYMLYKAKGTLIVYVDLKANSIGYRILSDIKVMRHVAYNNKKEILFM